MSKERLSFDSIQKHAAVLVRVLKSLRSTTPDVNSDRLWDAIQKRWSEEDLARALEVFKKRGHIAAFRRLFDELPRAGMDGFFLADGEKWGTAYAAARLTHASQSAIQGRMQTGVIRTRMGIPYRAKNAHVFVAVSDVQMSCSELVRFASDAGSLKADKEGFISHQDDKWGTPKSFGRLYGVSYKRIQKAIRSDPYKFRTIQGRVASGNPRPFYAKSEIEAVCKAPQQVPFIVTSGEGGFYQFDGKLWGEPKAFCRKFGIKSVKTVRARIKRAGCGTLLARNGQNRVRALYEDAAVRAACAGLIDVAANADESGFVTINGEKWGPKNALTKLLKISNSTIDRYLVASVRSMKCKDRRFRDRTFFALADVRSVCASLLSGRGKVGNDNLLDANGEKWGTVNALAGKLGVDHTTADSYKESCRSIKGKDRFGRPRTLYSFSDMRQMCQRVIDRHLRIADPVTDALLKKHARVLNQILRAVRMKRENVVSDRLWFAIKKNWSSAELIRAIGRFKKNRSVTMFLSLVSS